MSDFFPDDTIDSFIKAASKEKLRNESAASEAPTVPASRPTEDKGEKPPRSGIFGRFQIRPSQGPHRR